MHVKRAKYLVAFGVLFILACLSVQKTQQVTVFQPVKKGATTRHARSAPHSVPEQVQQQLTAGAQTVIQKRITLSVLAAAADLYRKDITTKQISCNLFPGSYKAYLSHIYPSHNFW